MSTWSVPGYIEARELGSGGSGRVVRAVDAGTGTPVAIKYLNERLSADPRFRREFRAEAALLRELDSPHVARFHRYVENENGAAIVVELVDGPSLRALLGREGATTPEAALTVLKGSLLGLSEAHRAGVVHRDYKPENVLVTADAVSKLIDFGIAAREGSSPAQAGSPMYMAPEQWQGGPASPATDVYAAAATFFECVTGARPFAGESLAEIAVQHLSAEVDAEAAPAPVRPLVLRGMAKDARDRPASAAAFLTELERAAIDGYGPGWEERGRRTLAVLAAGLLLPTGGPAHRGTDATTALATTALEDPGRPGTRRFPRTPTSGGRAAARSGSPGAGGGQVAKRSLRAPALAGAGLLLGVTALTGVLITDDSLSHPASAPSPVTGASGHEAGAGFAPPSRQSASPPVSSASSLSPAPGFTGAARPPAGDAGTDRSPAAGADAAASSTGGAGAVPVGGAAGGSGTTPPGEPGPAPAAGVQEAGDARGTGGPDPVPQDVPGPVAVGSVDIASLEESTQVRGADADLIVTTTSTDPVTLELTWYNSEKAGTPGQQDGATETYRLSGRTTYRLSYRHAFTTCPGYWGLRVVTTPGAAAGGAYQDMPSLACIVTWPERG